MKKFLIKSGIFVAFFLIFSVLANCIFLLIIIKTDFDFKKRLESVKLIKPDFNVLVLGASTALDGFDTELLTTNGFKAYNLALGGASIRTSILQLEEYLDICSKKPDYIIIGLNSQLVQTFDEDEINPIVEVTAKGYHFGLRDVPIVKLQWLGTEFLKKVVSKDIRQARLSYGQLRTERKKTDQTAFQQLDLNISMFKSSYWLGELSKTCHDHAIRLMIIEMPGFLETRNISSIGPHKITFPNGYHSYLYNFNSIEFCDFFDPSEDWLGNSHLNRFGAEKFTMALLPYLTGMPLQQEHN
jgi:hypothetical protein